MLTMGAYIVECDKLRVRPDSELRHDLINALMPYYCAKIRASYIAKKKLTAKHDKCYALSVANE